MNCELRNPNHPKKGSTTKVGPIRQLASIEAIKTHLASKPRDLCLFVFGINMGYRANELLAIKRGHVEDLEAGGFIRVWQSKTRKWRVMGFNQPCYDAAQTWLALHPDRSPDAPLFRSRTGKALKVPTVSNMVKQWCREAGLNGPYSSHSLRKTFGFQHRMRAEEAGRKDVLHHMMKMFGHANERQTLEYLCIEDVEIARLSFDLEL